MRGCLKIVVPIVAVAVFLSPGTGFVEETKKKSVNNLTMQ